MYGRLLRNSDTTEFRSQGYRGIWSIHLSGIFGEEGQLQLAEVHHRGIWSIHLSGPSGKESDVGFSATKFAFLLCMRVRGLRESGWNTYGRCLLINRGFMGCENPP